MIKCKHCGLWITEYKIQCPQCKGLIKPILGLMPRWRYEELKIDSDKERLNDICEAIKRYCESVQAIPIEWITEYNELIQKLKGE